MQGSTAKVDMASSWYGDKHVPRPWQDLPKRKKTVPHEQTLALDETRKRVAQAIASSLGTVADVAHEALYIGVELLDLAPIPGLAPAAKTLLNIWDAVEAVDMHRLSCLRLTERCADILLSVREEIYEAGDEVGYELAAPISKLEESFIHVYRFMVKQTNRPWLKRYLKRDEILRDIAGCDSTLRDALGLFGISIQIRILKQVQQNERRREQETQALLRAILNGGQFPPKSEFKMILGNDSQVSSPEPSPYVLTTEFSSERVTEFVTTNNALGLTEAGSISPNSEHLAPSQILPALETIHTVQNSLDAARDMSDLRQLMRNALQTSSDAEMLEVLQIGRPEMPDAIKTLQRALERLAEGDGEVAEPLPGHGIVTGKVVQKLTVNEVEGSGRTVKHTETMDTVISVDSSSSSGASHSGSSSDSKRKDTLDLEFIETGIDCLRRMSRGGQDITVPSWTITRYEVDRDEKIGIGFFSDVFRGTWRGRTVAIKVLAESTPRTLFMHEIGIWKTLHHPNVLPLYGASSTTGDPPWFFVSPYMKNGSLVEYLKRVEHEDRPAGLGVGVGANHVLPSMPLRSPGGRSITLPSPWSGVSMLAPNAPAENSPPGSRRRTPPRNSSNEVPREWDLFRFMHEIAKGMEYLHEKGVLHGDLKASNVLVSDHRYRCVIADFGLSEMKSEAYRISGTPPPHGTLRWQSPEIMTGQMQLTPEVDIWAFSICCVEVLTMGRMPWPLMDDTSVRHFVLKENSRPVLPRYSRFNTPGLQEILRACWQTEPSKRPSFKRIARDLKLLRKSSGQDTLDSPYLPTIEDLPEPVGSPSPDMRPTELPQFLQGAGGVPPTDILVGSLNSYHTAHEIPVSEGPGSPHQESTVATATIKMPEPVIYTPGPSSRSSSVFIPSGRSSGEHNVYIISDDGYDSPPPIDERIAEMKNERRYRLLLTHAFHPSLTLPLWDPSPVELGAVGYLSKPSGRFITLFNANNPRGSDHPGIRSLPSILGYGQATEGVQRLPKKTVTQLAIDMIVGSLTFRNSSSENIAKRLPFDLKAGHKAAYLYTDTTEYRYFETLDAAKKWFQSNVDAIMNVYSYRHHIQKEDLFLVIGTLRTPNYALLVSHSHPEGRAVFNVYSNPKAGKPWGMFTMDDAAPRTSGPSYDLEEPSEQVPHISASKVSYHGGPWEAVLLARLRFKPDVLEPTSK